MKKTCVPKLRFAEFKDSGEWEEKLVEEFTNCTAGGTPSTSVSSYWGGEIPWMNSGELNLKKVKSVVGRITEIGLKNSSTKIIPNKCILIGLAGQGKTRGTVAINLIELCINQSIAAIFPNKCFISEYLYHNLNARYDELRKLSAGEGGRAGLNLNIIKKIKIPFPKIKEQQKIADCLSSIDEIIDLHTQKLESLKEHKKSLMQNLFPREEQTTPQWRFPEFRDSGEWQSITLLEIAKFRRGSFPQPYGLPKWYDNQNGMPFIQVFDVDVNFKLKEKTKQKISKLGAEQSIFVPKETVIITIQGSIGRVAITQYDAYIDRTLLIFESFKKPTEKLFFAYVIYNLFEIEKIKAPGNVIKTITKEALSDFKIYITNLQEQQKIADCLSSIDEIITLQSQKIESLKQHKKGLMQGLFPSN